MWIIDDLDTEDDNDTNFEYQLASPKVTTQGPVDHMKFHTRYADVTKFIPKTEMST